MCVFLIVSNATQTFFMFFSFKVLAMIKLEQKTAKVIYENIYYFGNACGW